MPSDTKVRRALPYLTLEELWLCEKECYRALYVCVCGSGACSHYQTLRYDRYRELFWRERIARGDTTGDRSFDTAYTDAELEMLDRAWAKIEGRGADNPGKIHQRGEPSRHHDPTTLYHASPMTNADSIAREGIRVPEGHAYVSLSVERYSWYRKGMCLFEVDVAGLPHRMNTFLPDLDEIIVWGSIGPERVKRII